MVALLLAQKVRGNINSLQGREEVVPSRGFARQDEIPRFRVLANEDFLGVEPIGGRKAYRLATPVGEEFGNLGRERPWLVRGADDGWEPKICGILWYISRYIPSLLLQPKVLTWMAFGCGILVRHAAMNLLGRVNRVRDAKSDAKARDRR
jgi:hypothetical protein